MPVKKYSQKAELKDRDLELQKMEVEFQRKNLRQGLRRGKLGVILFTIMKKNLLADWHLRVKFVYTLNNNI